MLSCFACDIATGRVLARRQTLDRERKQTKVIVVHSMAAWRAGPAVAGSLEVIDRLFEALLFGVLGGALRERGQMARDVVGSPMMPRAIRSIGIVAKQDETAGLPRRVAPFQGRGEILAVAGIAARDRRPVGKGS